MLKKQLFRQIQSGEIEDWYRKVTDVALYMATGGFLEEANDLLKALWQYGLPHDRNTWLPDLAFEVLWYTANKRPAYTPFKKIDIDQIELAHRKYTSGDSYSVALPAVTWPQLEGRDAFRAGSILAAPEDGQFPSPETELTSLQLLLNSLNLENGLAGYEICSATALAAELASRNSKIETAIKMAKLWAEYYHANYLNYNFPIMACNRHVAPLLMQGIVADELKLSRTNCREFADKVISAMHGRMKNGQTLVYGILSWHELLKKLSDFAVSYAPDMFTDTEQRTKWIGRSPAESAVIAAAEQRLGLQLPEDYKAFLMNSNGFPEIPLMNPSLLPVEKINLLEGSSRDFFNIIKNESVNESDPVESGTEKVIGIGQPMEDIEVWMIFSPTKDEKWQCWYVDKYGETRYNSFRYFIEDQIQQLDEE